MIEQLTRSQQKQLAVCILVISLLFLFSVTLAPLWSINASGKEHIQLLQQRLAGLQQMVGKQAMLRPRLEHLKRAQINDSHFLKSITETRGAAELQRIVKTITTSNKATVTRTQILAATEEHGFTRITLKVRLRGPMRGIVETIHEIESNEPFLFLEELHLQDTSRRRSAAAVTAKQIEAEFELVAYVVHDR